MNRFAAISILTLLLFLGLLLPQLSAQEAPGFAWKVNFGGKDREQGIDILPTVDGQIAVLAATESAPARDWDAQLLLLDESGRLLWQKNYGSPGEDRMNALAQTFDGGYLLSGYTTTGGSGKKDGWLLRVDAQGDTLWQKTAGGPQDDVLNDVLQTADGGVAAAGSIQTKTGTQMWIYRTYADGQLRWQQTFGGPGHSEARALAESPDGHLAIAGITTTGQGSRNIWLFILDADGQPLHHQIFGNRQWEEVYDLIRLHDGGYAMAGFARSDQKNKGNGLKDMWLIKTAADGELVWDRLFGGSGNDSALGITETTDGGLVLVGYTFSHLLGANTSKASVLKCSANGTPLWEMEAFGGRKNDEVTAASLLTDGSIGLVGTTSSKEENAQSEDLWVMRLQPDFRVNTLVPTELEISAVKLRDNGDRLLEEGEKAYWEVTLHNRGRQDALDVILMVRDKNRSPGMEFRPATKIGYLPQGSTKRVFIPVNVLPGVEEGRAAFEFYCTDASRSRMEGFIIDYPTRPLEVPSNYLATAWLDPNPLDYDNLYKKVKTSRVPIRIKARSDRELLRRHFTVLINGIPSAEGQKAGEASLSATANGNTFDFEYQDFLDLKVGMNRVQVVVDNGSQRDSTAVFQIEYSNQPNLHILAIGIEHDDLRYTTKDAHDFAEAFEEQSGRLFDRVHLTTLTSGVKTKAGIFQTQGQVIKDAFANLKESYQYTIHENDLLVIFLSSHGRTINNRFKIVPSDYALEGEPALIDYAADIVGPLEDMACQKLLFIDACHSGGSETQNAGPVADGRSDVLLGLSRELESTSTLASCRADESSWEDVSWQNGAFTEAIIGAFRNEPFQDEAGIFRISPDDGVVTVAELYQYLLRRVPQMIRVLGKTGVQHPFLADKQLERIGGQVLFMLDR